MVKRTGLGVSLAEPLDRVAVRLERVDQPQAVLLVARDDRQLDLGVGDLERHALAPVFDRDDVSALSDFIARHMGLAR